MEGLHAEGTYTPRNKYTEGKYTSWNKTTEETYTHGGMYAGYSVYAVGSRREHADDGLYAHIIVEPRCGEYGLSDQEKHKAHVISVFKGLRWIHCTESCAFIYVCG